jgi:hypothetical protein
LINDVELEDEDDVSELELDDEELEVLLLLDELDSQPPNIKTILSGMRSFNITIYLSGLS